MSMTSPHPTAPAGFTFDPEIFRLSGLKQWNGPKEYAADEQLGAWATWTPELGVVVTVDTAGAEILHTVDELRAFHAAMGSLLAQIGEKQVTALTEGVRVDARNAEFQSIIDALGVTVVESAVKEGWGEWNLETRTIFIQPGLGAVQRRSVLARLLGHAFYGHEEASDEATREASEWAARKLINPARVAATLKAVNWLGLVARELEVLPSDLAALYASLSDEEQLGIREAISMEPRGYSPLG